LGSWGRLRRYVGVPSLAAIVASGSVRECRRRLRPNFDGGGSGGKVSADEFRRHPAPAHISPASSYRPPCRCRERRSRWSARSAARTNDLEVRRATAIICGRGGVGAVQIRAHRSCATRPGDVRIHKQSTSEFAVVATRRNAFPRGGGGSSADSQPNDPADPLGVEPSTITPATRERSGSSGAVRSSPSRALRSRSGSGALRRTVAAGG
jgi:hypothetical protein